MYSVIGYNNVTKEWRLIIHYVCIRLMCAHSNTHLGSVGCGLHHVGGCLILSYWIPTFCYGFLPLSQVQSQCILSYIKQFCFLRQVTYNTLVRVSGRNIGSTKRNHFLSIRGSCAQRSGKSNDAIIPLFVLSQQ